jgi:gluconokinase
MSTDSLDILQAALEGVALRLAIIAERLALPEADIYAGGGALTRSPAWARIIASAFGRPLHLQGDSETTARGVALLALDLNDAPLPVTAALIEPDPRMTAALRAARDRQEALYRQFYGG